MPTIDVQSFKLRLSPDAEVYQGYLRSIKRHWGNELYVEVADQAEALGLTDPKELHESLLKSSEQYQMFAWIERHLQEFKYSHRYGYIPEFESQTDEAEDAFSRASQLGPGSLHLASKLDLPHYYESTDFHHHKGGIWSDNIDAFAYEEGARTPFSVALGNERELHERFARLIAAYAPGVVVDLGCGFGKTTACVKEALPGARVIGIDLAAPVLRLAHLRGVEQHLDIEYLQANAECLPLHDDEADLVTSTMFVHEIPPEALRKVLREAKRVLRPGGLLVFLDFYCIPGGPVGRFFIEGHSRRNNEPFMREILALDLSSELTNAGFTNIAIRPFEEEAGALECGDALPRSWRFPWTTIFAEAESRVL